MAVIYDNNFGGDTNGQLPPNTTPRLDTATDAGTEQVIADASLTGGKGFQFANDSDNNVLVSFDVADNTADIEILTSIRMDDIAQSASAAHVWARGAGSPGNETGYNCFFLKGNNDVRLLRHDAGVLDIEETQPFTYATSDLVWLRYRIEGADVKIRCWLDGDPEPETWLIEHTDLDPLPAGWHAVGLRGNNNVVTYDTVELDDLVADAEVEATVTSISSIRAELQVGEPPEPSGEGSGFTHAMSRAILNHLFIDATSPRQDSYWLALFTTATDAGGAGTEVDTGNWTDYARVELTAEEVNTMFAVAETVSGVSRAPNNSFIEVSASATIPGADVTVTHIAVMLTQGGTDMLTQGKLTNPLVVDNGLAVTVPIGALTVGFRPTE